MRQNASFLFVVLLLGLIAAWSLVSAADAPRLEESPARRSAREWFGPWTALRAWQERVQKDLEAGRAIPPSRFDELFDDSFFDGRSDPFSLIEGFDEHFRPLLDERDKAAFGRSWGDWRRARIGLGAIKTRVEETDDSVVLAFDIPGLDSASVKLDVARGRVRLSYDARDVEEKTDAKGRVVSRSESSARFEKVVPVPTRADPDKYRVDKKGETIRLIFEKRETGLKS